MALLKKKKKAPAKKRAATKKKVKPVLETAVEEAPAVSQRRLDQRSVGLRRLGGKVVS